MASNLIDKRAHPGWMDLPKVSTLEFIIYAYSIISRGSFINIFRDIGKSYRIYEIDPTYTS